MNLYESIAKSAMITLFDSIVDDYRDMSGVIGSRLLKGLLNVESGR